jgi:hypothetical protein
VVESGPMGILGGNEGRKGYIRTCRVSKGNEGRKGYIRTCRVSKGAYLALTLRAPHRMRPFDFPCVYQAKESHGESRSGEAGFLLTDHPVMFSDHFLQV